VVGCDDNKDGKRIITTREKKGKKRASFGVQTGKLFQVVDRIVKAAHTHT
jgi:hypothetical protein